MSMLRVAWSALTLCLAAAVAGSPGAAEPADQPRTSLETATYRAMPEMQHRPPVEALSPDDRATLATRKTLEQYVAFIEFDKRPATEVFNTLIRDYRLNLHVQWSALSDHGVRETDPVSLRLHNVPLGAVLDVILAELDKHNMLCSYIWQGVIYITDRDVANDRVVTSYYDCSDLIDIPLDAYERRALARVLSEIAVYEGQLIPKGDQSNPKSIEDYERILSFILKGPDREERIEDLLEIIRENVEPDSWREHGGEHAAIVEYHGVLLITQTAAGHGQIERLLNGIRATLAARRSR